eukprot:s1732_g1.t1
MDMEANIFFNNSAPATSVREVFSVRSTPGRASMETADEAEDTASCSGRVQFRVVTALWFLCLVAMALPAPPLSLQVRIAGLVVYRQEPTILELFASLAAQSLCFAAVEVVLVVVAPLCCVLQSLFQPQTTCAKIAQHRVISPSVMGDVAAVALCTLYLSIQEPWSKFVRLCVRLPEHPWVLCAVLGAGVCSAWLRGSAQAAGAIRSQGLCCSACAAAVWVFWCLAICFLGPREPSRPANLAELNLALRRDRAAVVTFLQRRLPPSAGSCKELWKSGSADAGCRDVDLPSFPLPFPGLLCRVTGASGLRSVNLTEVKVFPRHTADSRPRWALRASGLFDALHVFVQVSEHDLPILDGEVCCPPRMNWTLQVSAHCSSSNAFDGNVSVDFFRTDDFHLDLPVHGG